jgi:hypothetical protein
MKIQVLYSMTLHRLVNSHRRLGGACCLHLQGSLRRNRALLYILFSILKQTLFTVEYRTVGGTVIRPRLYQWMMAILNNENLHCGGTIINNLYILAAEHCSAGEI